MSEFGPKRNVPIHAIGGYVGWSMPENNFVGEYHLREIIGEGSHGVVYLAERDDQQGQFAVKVSRANFARIFEKEGQHHALVTGSSRVISLIEYGSGEDDLGEHQYLVTPFREGGSLRDYLKFGALPLEEAVLYTNQMAEGVDNIHKHGIVHGDITPGNAYFTTMQTDSLELGDFSLSEQIVACDSPKASYYTDPQRDIVNLGLTTAAMLQGGKTHDISGEKLRKVLTNPKLYVEYAQPRVEKTRLRGRGAFVEPLLRAVSYDSDKQYPTATAFAEDIQARYDELLTSGPDRGRTFFVMRRKINEIKERINAL